MTTENQGKSDDVKRLKACINNLVSLLALPAIWTGGDPRQIIRALLDGMIGVLQVDFVYAEWKESGDETPFQMIRHASAKHPITDVAEVSRVLQIWVKHVPRRPSLMMRHINMAPWRLGLRDELGWVVAGSSRVPFPTETEKLLLSVAANQATIGLQEARLLGQQRQIAAELDQKVAERTKELQQLKDLLQRENVALREQLDETSMFEEIVGTAPALKLVISRVAKVAPADSTVLITGETGTGKELIARAIHKRSARSARAFVKVNCAAVPPALIASELFGHEKGAFTGALQRRLGRFELAQGGTLFLDEVGELPAETQIALLRVLQEHEFERVGGTQTIRADVRVIAATNRELNQSVHEGSFRSDLFYRLNVFPIEMPSLRARKSDIPMLTEYFVKRYADKMGKGMATISKKTLKQFCEYDWPGNIRELQNVIERSLILCETDTFSVDENWLTRDRREHRVNTQALSKQMESDAKALIKDALTESRGRISGPSGAAAKLGMPASTLESKIRSLKIDKYSFKHD